MNQKSQINYYLFFVLFVILVIALFSLDHIEYLLSKILKKKIISLQPIKLIVHHRKSENKFVQHIPLFQQLLNKV